MYFYKHTRNIHPFIIHLFLITPPSWLFANQEVDNITSYWCWMCNKLRMSEKLFPHIFLSGQILFSVRLRVTVEHKVLVVFTSLNSTQVTHLHASCGCLFDTYNLFLPFLLYDALLLLSSKRGEKEVRKMTNSTDQSLYVPIALKGIGQAYY